MTVRFLALYETPADPEAFDRHYREVHIPLGRRLPGLRRPGGQRCSREWGMNLRAYTRRLGET